MLILVIMFSVLMAFYAIEAILCRRWRKNISTLIHVNGIRGKSTSVRMIDAALKENGIQTIAKTTGSEAAYIMPDNTEVKIIRKAPANIREQIRTLRLASKSKCECLVIECMAVQPVLQKFSERILKADITVITNVKLDHIGVLGFDLDEIGRSLLNSKPKTGLLITDDFYDKLDEQHIKIKSFYDGRDSFSQNANMALTVCECLNLDAEKSKAGIVKFKRDIGQVEQYRYGNGTFINGFSANDYDSTDKLLKKYCMGEPSEVAILFNNRADRNYRLMLHIDLINKYNPQKVYLYGESIQYARRCMIRSGYSGQVEIIQNMHQIDWDKKLVIGIGNIKGMEKTIVEEFAGS